MALLLLLLFGGLWTQAVSDLGGLQNTTMSLSTLLTEVPVISEASAAISTVSTRPETVGPEGTISSWSQTPHPPSPIPFGTTKSSSPGLPAGDIINTPVPESATFREVSNKTSVQLPNTPVPESATSRKVSNKTSVQLPNTPVPESAASQEVSNTTWVQLPERTTATRANSVTDGAVTFTSPGTFKGTSAPPVTMTTSYEDTSEPSVATTVSSKSSGPPVTMTTESLGLSSVTHGLPDTIATSSVESSSVAGGTPVFNIKISTMSTPEPVTNRTPHQGSSGMLLVPMLVALLVVLVLVALLLLWRRRQKRRTGALTLSGGGKRNGVVDAWAGPARVPDEEAATAAASGSGGNKGSAALEREGSGQLPTLTTFFSRRKSRQGSLVLEELKSGPGPDLKGEEEPLVGSEEDEAVETPTSDGLDAKDGAPPQSL